MDPATNCPRVYSGYGESAVFGTAVGWKEKEDG